MHAALMHLTIDPALAPAAAAAFTNELLPRVRTALGFVAGYWMEPVERQGFGFVVRDGGASAQSHAAGHHLVSARGGYRAVGHSTGGRRDTVK